MDTFIFFFHLDFSSDLSFPLTIEERLAYGQIFKSIDVENKGVINNTQAATLLSKSKLSQVVLSEVSFFFWLLFKRTIYGVDKGIPTQLHLIFH